MNINWKELRSYFIKGILLLLLCIISVSFSNGGVLPFTENYPAQEFNTVLVGVFFLAILYELLYWRYYRDELVNKFNIKIFGYFQILCLLITIGTYPIFYFFLHPSFPFSPFYLSTGLILTILNSFIWVTIVYGFDIYYSIQKSNAPQKIEFKKVKGSIFLLQEDIAGAFIQNQIVYLLIKDGSRIPIEHTLNEVEEKIDSNNFLRVNRQYILKHWIVQSVKKATNQKIKLHLIPQFDLQEEIMVSRYKAEEVKKWLSQSIS